MKKYMLSLVALVVAVAAMAFTNVAAPAEAAEEVAAVQYQFNGNDMEDVYDLEFWAEVEGSGPSCGGDDLPCIVTVQSGSLESWLSGKTQEQIRLQATSRKN